MSTSTIALLLQMTASLLAGAKSNPSLTASTTAQIVAIGNHAVQLAAQADARMGAGFAVPQNTDIWPTVGDLMQSGYLNNNGAYVAEGEGATLEQSTISFGDLNADGFDDAAAIVDLQGSGGTTEAALAMFLNQGGVMFNIADLPLGTSLSSPLGQGVTVYSHEIANGVLTIDMQVAGQPRATSTYELLGNRIVKI